MVIGLVVLSAVELVLPAPVLAGMLAVCAVAVLGVPAASPVIELV